MTAHDDSNDHTPDGPFFHEPAPSPWNKVVPAVLLFLFGFIALPVVDVVVLIMLAVAGVPRGLAITICLVLYGAGLVGLGKFFPKPALVGALLGAVIPLIAFGACYGL